VILNILKYTIKKKNRARGINEFYYFIVHSQNIKIWDQIAIIDQDWPTVFPTIPSYSYFPIPLIIGKMIFAKLIFSRQNFFCSGIKVSPFQKAASNSGS
jgi:hypothetical protein